MVALVGRDDPWNTPTDRVSGSAHLLSRGACDRIQSGSPRSLAGAAQLRGIAIRQGDDQMADLRCKADNFRALHIPGRPLVLFNVWDPGTAKAVAAAGASAIATGSWSVAAAYGFNDGEQLPLQ